MEQLSTMFWTLLEQLPSLITILACLVFALTRWKTYPKVALIVVISLLLLLLHAPIFAAIYAWVPDLLLGPTRDYRDPTTVRNTMLLLGFLFHTALAIPFALLLVSIFMKRTPPAEEA